MHDPILPGVERRIVLLDGGMGQELRHRGAPSPDGMWSAQALIDDPSAVLAVHRDYARAGADVLTTCTYCTVRRRFEEAGIAHRLRELNELAGRLARRAADEAGAADGRKVLVAGGLPPLHSYRPELSAGYEDLEGLYREQAEFLAPFVDLFLCETMGSAAEARAAARAAAVFGKPVWVAWTLQDHGSPLLRSGETVGEAAAALDGVPVAAFLANCCAPESITAAMPDLAALGPAGGYANGFHHIPDQWTSADTIDALGRRDDLTPDAYAAHAQGWIAAGARIVGGCCEVGPAHIARLNALLG